MNEGSITIYPPVYDPADTGFPPTRKLVYSIDWGDASVSAAMMLEATPAGFTHVYDDANGPINSTTYTLKVNAYLASDFSAVAAATTTTLVTVDNVAPTIVLSGAASATAGAAYALNLGAITDPGKDTVSSRIIDWGDGSTQTVTTGGEVLHTYTGSGARSIRVTLVDEDGKWADAGKLDISVTGGTATDLIVGTSAANTLVGDRGGAADDWIFGLGGNDSESGLQGNDKLFGNTGRDKLSGGPGDDHLVGGANDDQLDGGPGNDRQSGGAGSDWYFFGIGSGQDEISEALASSGWDAAFLDSGAGMVYVPGSGDMPQSGDYDELVLGAGVTTSNLKASRVGNALLLRIDGTSDQVLVRDYFADGIQTIEAIDFANGSKWGLKDVRKLVIVPTAGNDTIIGYRSDDNLSGLGGDDVIDGREGNDILAGGEGLDTLTGGSGYDRFVFSGAGALTGPDLITDFTRGVDKIVLSAAVFTKLRAGTVVDPDANLYIDYDAASGALIYDADGINSTPGVTIAILGVDTHPASLGYDIVIGS